MRKTDHSIVIGVSGGSGIGKTTFCSNLAKNLDILKVKVISTDDYFKEVKPKANAPFNGKEYDDYDHPTSVDIDKLNRDINHLISSKMFDVVIGLNGLAFRGAAKEIWFEDIY